MSLVLHYSPDSANLIVRATLEEIGAPYEAVLVDRSRGGQRSAEYLALNPQGLIPVLVDGEQVIFETAAIVTHLVDTRGAPGPAPGDLGRAALYQWLFYLSNTLHADLRVRFYTDRHVVDPAAVPTLRAGTRNRLMGHLALLDAHLGTTDDGWMLNGGFSVCDIYLATCCRWMMIYPAAEPEPRESLMALGNLWRLLERVESRPAYLRACRAEWIAEPPLTRARIPEPPTGGVTD